MKCLVINIEIQNTNFSPTNIALANYVIEQTPTGSNVGGALLYINRKHTKFEKTLHYTSLIKLNLFLLK